MTIRLSEIDDLHDLQILENTRIDQSQQQLNNSLRRRVRELSRQIQRLESILSCTFGNQDELILKVGSASLVMKKDGTIVIDGKNITIKASSRIEVKSSNTLTLKGQKILEN